MKETEAEHIEQGITELPVVVDCDHDDNGTDLGKSPIPTLEANKAASAISEPQRLCNTTPNAQPMEIEFDEGEQLQQHEQLHQQGESNNDDAITASTSVQRTNNFYIKLSVGLFLLTFLAFVITDTATNGYIKSGMRDFLEWVEDNPGGGVLVFIIVIFFTTLLFVPGIILTFGSGYVFSKAFGLGVGVVMGSLAVFVGAGTGAIVSFLLGRFLLRDCVAGLSKRFKLFEAFDQAMGEKGFRIMLFLRLSPVIYASPYLNYTAGGTALSFGAYCLSLLAIIPSTFMFVFLGASAGSLSDSSGDSSSTTIVLVVGIVASAIAIVLTTHYVRQELKKVTAEQEVEQTETNQLPEENDSGHPKIKSTSPDIEQAESKPTSPSQA